MIELDGRVALVTGGGSGIGRGICQVLAAQGAVVAVADLDLKAAEAVAASITGNGGRSRAFQVDVTIRSSVATLVEVVVAARGRIDILVNNAGVVGAPGWEQRDRPDASDWNLTHAVNLRGVVNVSEAVAEQIHQDFLAFMRTVKLPQVEGASGFQHLKEDLEERARLRSHGRVGKILIRTLLFE